MTTHARLDPDENDAWMNLLALVEYLPGLLDQQLKRDANLGRFEYAVLLMLTRAPDRTRTMLELSAVTFGSLSRLSHTVTRLENRGLVTRTRNGSNRYVALTSEGRAAFAAAVPGHLAEIRRLVLDHLPDGGSARLAELLTPVVDHLREIAPRT
ncbi:MarR family winged helix-turn-helix transcriptional regulator [Homoserinibacter sp. GY 40078]|uniref:MarR family winged helix-turn-helix transcriptional regulator n=1 Tax=Homoserinibacter sp. GY 40078 TaxID=2603275 RepID=UPI0011C7A1FA|nr:MarR family transcriptional regulator [Homoserinibacter sp. GY 40078]TXK18647.1 MarR family transcriptional regulator [Homoserinibacter sp. GY 40078]